MSQRPSSTGLWTEKRFNVGALIQIKIMYKNNRYGFVDPSALEQLTMASKIKKFLRSEGWAVIGRDPIRTKKRRFSDKKING
jgi:hypothetical protein